MFQNDCTLPLSADLFTQAVHPTEPLLTVGLSSGHVECYRLPSSAPSPSSDSSDGKSLISSAWRTRRHKGGSCRALAFALDGRSCYSAGTDGLVKQFCPETGRVASKVRIAPSMSTRGQPDQPSILRALGNNTLLLACDSGAVHLYDLRGDNARPGARPAQIHISHDDFVSSLTPLPPVGFSEEVNGGLSSAASPKQFVSTGGTTLAVTDLRKGTIAKSEDQEDELLCSVFVPGLGPKHNRNNGVIVVGGASGVLTLWDRGSWDDQQDRVYINRLESVDAAARIPGTKKVVTAVSNGHLAVVDLGGTARELDRQTLNHDDESAVAIDFDCHGRMITGGGKVVKVWEDIEKGQWEDPDGDEDEGDEDEDGKDDSDGDENDNGTHNQFSKRKQIELSDSDSDGEDTPRQKKKKGKKGKKGMQQQVGVYGHHGVMGFSDL